MGKHPSHDTRLSDASSFDEICKRCGATDEIGSWGRLALPCTSAGPQVPERVAPLESDYPRMLHSAPMDSATPRMLAPASSARIEELLVELTTLLRNR